MNNALRVLAIVSAASVAFGCVFFTSPQDRALRKTPSFKDGYADGCAAATTQGANFREGPEKDDTLYDSDKVYRAGWANGYQTCGSTQRSIGASPNSSPVPEPVIGGH